MDYGVYDLKVKFSDMERVTKTNSQVLQDLFVLVMTNGKRGGTYLEIGASWPVHLSNTKLLEADFAWKGLGLDLDENMVEFHTNERLNPVLCADATEFDYAEGLKMHGLPLDVDYLSCDCEPAENTLKALKKAFADGVRPGIITFEHEEYTEGTKVRDESREFLLGHGYELLCKGISLGDLPFEDWWVHKERFSPYLRAELWSKHAETCKAEEILFGS